MPHRTTAALLLVAVLCTQVMQSHAQCTTAPTPVTNGAYTFPPSCDGSSNNIGTNFVCVGDCDSGYVVPNPSTPPSATCSGSTWEVSGATCALGASCQNPPPAISFVLWSSSTCSTGSTSSGVTCKAACTTTSAPPAADDEPVYKCDDGSWKFVSGSCVEKGCTGPPPVLSDDSVTWDPSCSDPKPAGTNCMGSCPTGYETTCGTPKAQCHYGSWGFSCANCQPSPCPNPPPTLTNVNWEDDCKLDSNSFSGKSCSGTCAAGTTATGGTPTATCSLGTWTLGAGTCQAPGVSSPCSTNPSSTLVANAVWSCPYTSSGGTCTGSCSVGAADSVNGPPVAICSDGQWTYVSGACTGCTGVPPSSLTNNTSWGSCPALGSADNATCTGSCNTGFTANITAGGLPVARCDMGTWKLEKGACLDEQATPSSSSCNSSALPAVDTSFNWPSSCTAAANLPNGTACSGNCSIGYAASSDITAPSTGCINGTWTAVAGACLPKGCMGNPVPELSPNTTWNCPAATPHLGNCTGACSGSSSSGNAGPPVAVCLLGQWGYGGGTCTGGGKTRFYTVEGPQELIDAIAAQVAAGVALSLINEELANYQALLQKNWPQLAGYTDVQLADFFVTASTSSASNRRRLSATGNAVITVGFQMKSIGSGLYNFAQESVLDYLTSSPTVTPAVTSWAIGAAVKTNSLPADFNFTGVTVGASDAAGDYVKPPVKTEAAACFLAFQTNSSRTPPQADTPPEPATVLCPDAKTFSASFPYQSSSAATDVSFEATAVNVAGAPGVASGVECTVSTGAAGTMSPLVTCQRTDGSPFPSGALYKILLTAKFMCGSNALRAFSSANFRIQETPKIIVLQQGAKRPLVCSDAGQVTVEYNYTMTGDQGAGQVAVTAAATSSGPGISCTAVLSKGAETTSTVNGNPVSTGTATVTCKGPLKTPSNVDVNLMLTAKPQGCAAMTTTEKTRVSITCCGDGRSYARQQSQAKCFSHYLPGTISSECSKSSPVYGFYNQGPASAKLSFFDDTTKKCATRATVGTAVMSCDSSNKKLVKFTVQSSNTDLKADQQFLLTCAPPSTQPGKCPGESRWQKVGLKKYKASIRLAGRTKITSFSASLTAKAKCDCQDAVWAVYESGVFTGLPAKQFC